MKESFPELPGWTFDVEEVSPGVYELTGHDSEGNRIQMTGTDVEELTQEAMQAARRIGTNSTDD